MSLFLSDWSAIEAAGLHQVGGKAFTLARLARHLFPIPRAVVLPVRLYRDWLDSTDLEAALQAVAATPSVEQAIWALHEKLKAVPLPDPIVHHLTEVLGRQGWQDRGLAVRSSAPQEDGTKTSFAGVHETCLNVIGAQAVAQAVVSVWASLWTPSAVAYRHRFDIRHEDAAMAVLLMPMIPAKASGIGFTRNPLTGRDDQVVIHANWGLGESLVAGHSAGDEILLEERQNDDVLTLRDYRVGSKTVQIQASNIGGTEQSALSPERREAPTLSGTQALELGNLMRLAAWSLDFSRPDYDLEWAWDGAQFWLLQARPITAANHNTYPALQGQPDIWSRGNTKDVVPDPLNAMDWGVSRKLANAMLIEGYRLAGFKLLPALQRVGLHQGRLYLNMSLLQWEGYASFALPPAAMNKLVGGHQPEIKVGPLTWKDRLNQALGIARYMRRLPAMQARGYRDIEFALQQARTFRNAPLPQIEEDFIPLFESIPYLSLHGLLFLQGSGGGGLSMLVRLLESALPGRGHAIASALLAGGTPSVTAEQGYALARLAKRAMSDPETAHWLTRRAATGADWRNLPKDSAFKQDFAAFLETYGHRGVYETYVRTPRWREQPDYLLDSLPGLAEVDLDALIQRQKDTAQAALREAKAALPWWRRGMLEKQIAAAQAGSNGREAARSALIAYIEPVRRLALHLGERWTAKEWLNQPDDIFHLLRGEILAVLHHDRPGAALLPLVEDRKAQFLDWQNHPAPDVVLDGADSGESWTDPAPTPTGSGQSFIGVPVGHGLAVGPVRKLHHPTQGHDMRPGDILVVPSTDPAWTPLFLKAGGLVMETGGFMSHGAIVAREFGIPAVVNLPGILNILQDGEAVRVDGGKGVVERISP